MISQRISFANSTDVSAIIVEVINRQMKTIQIHTLYSACNHCSLHLGLCVKTICIMHYICMYVSFFFRFPDIHSFILKFTIAYINTIEMRQHSSIFNSIFLCVMLCLIYVLVFFVLWCIKLCQFYMVSLCVNPVYFFM